MVLTDRSSQRGGLRFVTGGQRVVIRRNEIDIDAVPLSASASKKEMLSRSLGRAGSGRTVTDGHRPCRVDPPIVLACRVERTSRGCRRTRFAPWFFRDPHLRWRLFFSSSFKERAARGRRTAAMRPSHHCFHCPRYRFSVPCSCRGFMVSSAADASLEAREDTITPDIVQTGLLRLRTGIEVGFAALPCILPASWQDSQVTGQAKAKRQAHNSRFCCPF